MKNLPVYAYFLFILFSPLLIVLLCMAIATLPLWLIILLFIPIFRS